MEEFGHSQQQNDHVPSCSETGQPETQHFSLVVSGTRLPVPVPSSLLVPLENQTIIVIGQGPSFWYYRRRKLRIAALLSTLVKLVAVVITLGVVCYWVPILTATATVTIVPAQKVMTVVPTLSLDLKDSTLDRQRVQLRPIPTLTVSQSVTVRATGIGHQLGVVARGLVTFLNWSWSVRVIPVGTTLITHGIRIVTDQEAIVPGAIWKGEGWDTVSAHAVAPGTSGNIASGALEGTCCTAGVSYTNYWPFTGGRAAAHFPLLTQRDVDQARSSLFPSLESGTHAALATQARQDETLLTPFSCDQRTVTTHPVGAAVSSTVVTLSEECRHALTLNTSDLETVVTRLLIRVAQERLGGHYSRVGASVVKVLGSEMRKQRDGMLSLEVQGTGTWEYQLTSAQAQAMISSISGQSIGVAQQQLRRAEGVGRVTVQISGLEQSILPIDADRICMVVVVESGTG